MKSIVPTALLTLLVAATTAGCATTTALHTETLSASVRAAEDLGAGSLPQASLHLQLAKEELEAANALHKQGDLPEAESLLLRAEADAELAVALSRAENERAAAEAAVARVRALQAENPYAPGSTP